MLYILIVLLVILLVIKVSKRVMIRIGKNIELSDRKLIVIATDYVAYRKTFWIQRYKLKIDTDFSFLVDLIRIEIAANELRTVRELKDYLHGKFEQEVKIVFEQNA